MEVFNSDCAFECDRGGGSALLDQLLVAGRRIGAIAVDDAHFYQAEAPGGWVMVKAAENDPDALVESLKAGTYYSSQGPELRNIVVTDDEIVVESSSVVSMIVQAQGNTAKAVHGLSMTRSSIELHKFAASPWVRVTVIDAAGKRAWSNPIWLD